MKMTKRVLALLFAVAILLSLTMLPASAGTTDQPRLIDDSDLLSADEEAKLTSLLTEYSKKQDCDIVFLLVDDFSGADFNYDGTTADFADTYYDTHGYDEDGVLVLLVQNNENGKRHIYFSTSGKCIKRLNEDEWNEIIDDITTMIPARSLGKDGDYYPTLEKVANEIDEKLTPHLKWYMLPIALFIGFVIAMVIMNNLRAKLKTVVMQRGAASYVRDGSMNITQSRDTYLYSTVTRTEKPKNDSRGGHSSSGGGYHSGGGRDI